MSGEARTAAIRLAQWAADECERQRVGPLRVPDMIRAAVFCEERMEQPFSHTQISALGRMVEPGKLQDRYTGYRTVNVTIGGVVPLPEVERVPTLMGTLLEGFDPFEPFNPEGPQLLNAYASPTEFYRIFEEIHPFADGNGRVGSILWNKLRGDLEYPYTKLEAPPDLWSEKNKERAREAAQDVLIRRMIDEAPKLMKGLRDDDSAT